MDYFETMISALDVNILTIAYRGYSQSEGTPSEEGLKEDGLDIMRWARDNKDTIVAANGDIYLLGRSLGGAVATYVATHPDTPVDLFTGVILESTFTSIDDMVDVMFYPPITTLKSYILDMHWKSIDLITKLNMPVLYVSGDKDELVPHEMTLQLYDATTSSTLKEKFVVAGGMHNDTW